MQARVQHDQRQAIVDPDPAGAHGIGQHVGRLPAEPRAREEGEAEQEHRGDAVSQPGGLVADEKARGDPERQEEGMDRSRGCRIRNVQHQGAEAQQHEEDAEQQERGASQAPTAGEPLRCDGQRHDDSIECRHRPDIVQCEVDSPVQAESEDDCTAEQQHPTHALKVLGVERAAVELARSFNHR